MNHSGTTTSDSRSPRNSGDDRDLFVIDDQSTIPASELRHIVGGAMSWIQTVVSNKLGRSKSAPNYVVELRRMTKSRHIPKRMEKHFDAIRSKLESLNFSPNFESTIPAVGPYACTMMAMSRRDGDIHFEARGITRQSEGHVVDEGDFRFLSWLTDCGVLITTNESHLPSPRSGVERTIVASEDPAAVLKKHREQMRRFSIEQVPPAELFDRVEAEHRQHVEDLLQRRIVRLATAAEVTRIRKQLRV